MIALPSPRGLLSERLLGSLVHAPHPLGDVPVAVPADPLGDEDLQLSLFVLYELHYRGVQGIDDRWEWDPGVLALRARLEAIFEDALRAAVPRPDAVAAEDADLALRAIAAADDAPSVSKHLERSGTIAQLREMVVHRSPYQLKEADPHTWAIPRLGGRPKAALVEIQADEYGNGTYDRLHANLFAKTMRALGLDDTYGAYVDAVGGLTLATVNLMSLCGLHRRLRGAIVGHLALVEVTSSVPSRRYGDALRRLGLGEDATDFYDEHVTADAIHESIAAVDLAGGLMRDEPEIAADVLWGAQALVVLDARLARHCMDAWASGRSSLRAAPLAVVAA